MYRLKPTEENITIVDGPFASRKFTHGEVYGDDQVPPGEIHRFETIVTEERRDGGTEKGKKASRTGASDTMSAPAGAAAGGDQ